MSPSSQSPCTARTRRSGPAVLLLSVFAAMVLAAVMTGCGGGQEDDAVLATVGKKEIKASYYEDRLSKLERNELPRAEDGTFLDMSSEEGKRKFLDTLINKEIMVKTAEDMGLQNDPGIVAAKDALQSYEASMVMWNRVITEPSKTISPEELEAFYAKMGSTRPCLYVICNFRDDAEAAREMALSGADWEDVVRKYHDGGDSPTGVNEITVPFGRYNIDYENKVFGTEIGGVTPPIDSIYGYWVLKVLEEKPGKKPDLEEATAQILDVTYNRKVANLKESFKQNVMEKHKLTIHEDALWKCYLGLPEGETIFREGTQEPLTREELRPLEIAPEDLDMPFYSYVNPDGLQEYTLLDYKIHFDNMSVFQRPKESEMLGGLRSKLSQELGKTILNLEAKDRGLFEDPEVVEKVDIKIEEMIVNKLYSEVVKIEDRITPEEMDAFWAEHSTDYIMPENRDGHMVICRNADQAAAARSAATEGMAWKDILVTYGTDQENKFKSGKWEGVILKKDEPISHALFSLQPGELSEPFDLGDGRFGVIRLDAVNPEWMKDLNEVKEVVGQRMKEIRKEEAFQAEMAKWTERIPVQIKEGNLAGLASWEDLTTTELPENLVPRN